MNSIIKSPDENSGRLIGLFQALIDSLPPGTVSLGSRRTKNDDGTIVWLSPSNKQAAEFSAHLEDGNSGLVDVSFGRGGTTLELPWEARLPSDASFDTILEVVKNLALAVIAGRCEERFGFLGVRGTIRAEASNIYRSTHFFHFHLFPRTVRYVPYESSSNAERLL
jgi:hypothetical protein